eukprot:11640796-Heterocapsa_arctica.AAC.1
MVAWWQVDPAPSSGARGDPHISGDVQQVVPLPMGALAPAVRPQRHEEANRVWVDQARVDGVVHQDEHHDAQ